MASCNSLDQNLTPEMRNNLFGNAFFNMLWHCPSDPRFPYWVHIPDTYLEDTQPNYGLMVIIHGTGCETETYIREARKLADIHHIALLAPLFPGGLLERNDFNSYKLLSSQGIRYDLILLSMIEDMKQRYPGIKTDRFFMFGHSGGGQFCNRFLFAHPNRLKAVSIGAPGRPTYLNFQEDYFWGVRDFKRYFDKDIDLEMVRQVPVQLTVGEMDNKYIGDSPYGINRIQRMNSLKKNLENNGVSVSLEILPGLGHIGGEAIRINTAQKFFLRV